VWNPGADLALGPAPLPLTAPPLLRPRSLCRIASLLSVLVTLLLLELGLFGLSIVLAAKARKMVRYVRAGWRSEPYGSLARAAERLPTCRCPRTPCCRLRTMPATAMCIARSSRCVVGVATQHDSGGRSRCLALQQQQRKTFCPCTVPVDTPTSSLFWLRSKGLYRGLIQMIILYQALTLAVLARSVIAVFSDAIYLTLIIAGVVVVLLACIVFLAIPYLVRTMQGPASSACRTNERAAAAWADSAVLVGGLLARVRGPNADARSHRRAPLDRRDGRVRQ